MSKQVTVQAVAGAIRATDGILKSHKFTKSGKGIRSVGVYVEKNSYGEIVLDYWTAGYNHQALKADQALANVITTLARKGFAVNPTIKKTWLGDSVALVIEVA
jgi:hypothetical protein